MRAFSLTSSPYALSLASIFVTFATVAFSLGVLASLTLARKLVAVARERRAAADAADAAASASFGSSTNTSFDIPGPPFTAAAAAPANAVSGNAAAAAAGAPDANPHLGGGGEGDGALDAKASTAKARAKHQQHIQQIAVQQSSQPQLPSVTGGLVAQVIGAYIGTVMLLLESARYFRNWAVDDDEDRRLCLWATKAVGFFYCLVIMAVMLFLHHRASIASERNSPLMRFIFVLIMFMVPFSFAVGWISDAFVVPHQGAGVCVPHYPLPLSIALLIGNTALSGLLIYKFVSVLQYHAREWRRIKGGMSGGTAPAQRNILAIAGHAKTIASRNLFYSTSALLFSDVTMIALTSMDIANINHPDQIIMTVVDIAGSIDVFVNVLAIFACSSIWMPHEMKSRFSGPRHAASPTASRAGRRDVDRRPSQQPLSVDNQFGSMGRGRIGYQGESTQGIDANTLNMAFSDGEDDRFGDAKRYQGGPTAQHYQQHQHQHQQQQPQQSWSLGYLRTMQLPADPAPTGSPVYPSTSPYPLLTSAGPPTGSSGHSQSTLVGVPTNRIPQQHLQQQQQQLPAQHGTLSYPPSYPPVQGNPQQQQPYRQQYQQQYHQQYQQQQQQQQQQHQPYGRSNTYGMEAGGGTATAQQQQQTLQLSGEANWSNRVPEPWWISHPGK